MKKKAVSLLFTVIFTVLTACGNDSPDNPGNAEPTKAEAVPTEATVTEPTKATVPIEVSEEPTPEPKDGEPVIEGVYFDIYVMNADYEDVMGQCNFPEPRLVFFDYKTKPFEECDYAILKSGETYHFHFGHSKGFYAMLYAPKEMEYASIIDKNGLEWKFYDKAANPEVTGTQNGRLESTSGFEFEGGTITKDFTIKYEDGSEEIFTITITDQ